MKILKLKLKEFDRWRSIAGFYPLYMVDCFEGHFLPLFEPPNRSGANWENLPEWSKQAPEEVNEYIKALNKITDERYRIILLMAYICPYENRQSFYRFSDDDIMTRIGLKKSQFYREKREALQAFAENYRDGLLLTYTG